MNIKAYICKFFWKIEDINALFRLKDYKDLNVDRQFAGSFIIKDYVLSTEPLEHVENPQKIIAEFCKI